MEYSSFHSLCYQDNNNEFKLATSKTGAAVHSTLLEVEMVTLLKWKKLEKSLITIDGVSRSPLAFTPINYTLNNNGGSISVGATYFGISGILLFFQEMF